MRKQRVHIRLPPDLAADLEAMAQPRSATKSAIVEAALRAYLDPNEPQSETAALLRRLDRFDLRQGAIERDMALLVETLGQYVLYWLTRTEPLPDGERDIAHALGQKRFDYFIEQVVTKLTGDARLSDRLFREPPNERA